eukprot:9501870-Pyramimonas_sp.AAC.1
MAGGSACEKVRHSSAQNRPFTAPGWPRAAPGRLGRPQDTPKGPREATKTAPEGPGTPKDGLRRSRLAQDGSRDLQDGPRSLPRGLLRGSRVAEIVDFHCVFRCFWPSRLFGFPRLQDGPR